MSVEPDADGVIRLKVRTPQEQALYFSTKMLEADRQIKSLERQLSEARGAIDLLRAARNGDATANLHFSMKCRDLESKLTAYQSAFGKVRDKLEALSDPMNWHSRQMVGEPEYLRFTTWTYPIDQKGNAPLIIAEEALTLLSTLNAQDEGKP